MLLKKTFRAWVVLCMIMTFGNGLMISHADASSQISYYVDSTAGNDNNPGTLLSPFRTIGKARDVIRTLNTNMEEDIVVFLRGGTYTLTDTLSFTDRDSGSNGHFISYRAYSGETPVISGERSITGWTLHDQGEDIYRASVGEDLETRQLYVNGKRAVRARSDAGLADAAADANGLTTTFLDIAHWGNIRDIEMVFNEKWTNSRGGVDSITVSNGKASIKMKQPAWYNLRNKNSTSVNVPWYYENAYELLDQEGEWYLDRQTDTFYYKPRAGEDMATAQVIVPSVEKLITLQGGGWDKPIRNIRFEGISFEYTTWLRPNSEFGHPDVQSNILRESDPVTKKVTETLTPAAVEVETGHSIVFERCRFAKLGSAAINLTKGSQDILIQGNSFTDISGSGIQVGEINNNEVDVYNPIDPRRVMRNDDILNNYFYNLGVEYRSSVAIFAAYPQDMDIRHNEIANLPYSGITIGWGWGEYDTSNRRVRIENNFIHNVMLTLHDGGAIYTLGTSHDMKIRGNYLKDQEHEQSTLYFDMGSTWIEAEDNVVENSPLNLYINPASDIRVSRTYTDNYKRVDLGTRNDISDIVYVPDRNWPDAARAIINNAGLEAAYRNIVTEPQILTPVSDKRPQSVPLPPPIPVDFSGKRSLVTGFVHAGKIRNNYESWVGMKLTVGNSPLTVTAIGRVNLPGSLEQHPLKIVDATTKQDVPGTQVTLQMAQAAANGDFKYVQLPAPVTLEADKSYYVMSWEMNGGDLWYDSDMKVSSDSAATINLGAWGPSYKDGSPSGNSFVGLDLLYQGVSSDTPVPVLLPTAPDQPSPNPIPVPLPVDLDNTAGLVDTVTPATLRNDWNGWAGMKVTVGSRPLVVSSLGRMIAEASTGTHKLRLVDAETGGLVAETLLQTEGAAPGQFKYAELYEPVQLKSGKSYYVLSLEQYGGDGWYDGTAIKTMGDAATIVGGSYQSDDNKSRPFMTALQPGQGFVGVDFRYRTDILAGVNDIANSGFEFDTSNWTPYNANVTRVTTATYNDSEGSAKVTMAGSFGMAYQNVALQKNKTYEISVWVKLASGASTAQIILDHGSGTPRYEYLAANTPVDTTWRQLKAEYNYTGSNADGTGAIQIRIGNGTTLYTYFFDDFIVKESTEQVVNGGFEANTGGWTPYNATITRVTDATYRQSAGSAKVVVTNTFGMAYQNLTLEKNTRYDISAMVKLDSEEGYAQIILDHGGGTPRYEYLATTQVGTTWTQLKTSYVYTGSNDNGNAAIWIRFGDGKTKTIYYLDDISVKRVMMDRLYMETERTLLSLDAQPSFKVYGTMSDGSEADLANAQIRFLSSDSTVVQAVYGETVRGSVYGHFLAKREGTVMLRAVATFNGRAVQSPPILIQVDGTAPTASLEYSSTSPTNEDVTATITPSEPVTITNNGGSGSYTFRENGSYTFEFVDAAGNHGTATATVANIDKLSPTLNLKVDKPILQSPNHKMVPINVEVQADGTGSGIASVVLASITSNQPDNGKGDGDTSNDIQDAAFGTYDTSFSLRTERSGNGGDRIYTIIYTVKDMAGNEASASTQVVVTHG